MIMEWLSSVANQEPCSTSASAPKNFLTSLLTCKTSEASPDDTTLK